LLSLLDALPILRRSFLRRACLPRWSNTTTKNTVFARSIPTVVDLFMVSSCLFSFLNRCLASISSGASRRRRGRGRRPSHRAPARPAVPADSIHVIGRYASSSWCSTFPEQLDVARDHLTTAPAPWHGAAGGRR